ncbi:hypothetical protein P5Y53_16185 [Dyella jiangningensis]|uniref:hypothetical protein n=1 Tax=Dyella jiangningensis TaxID=1379159 RepID=UPI0024108936|nr:hypothetical protein [Dyella jiangningensis]MDG2539216.1 hypothetical protein [Dyella jiangningensis]
MAVVSRHPADRLIRLRDSAKRELIKELSDSLIKQFVAGAHRDSSLLRHAMAARDQYAPIIAEMDPDGVPADPSKNPFEFVGRTAAVGDLGDGLLLLFSRQPANRVDHAMVAVAKGLLEKRGQNDDIAATTQAVAPQAFNNT